MAAKTRLPPAEVVAACRRLGLNRTRFYKLLGQYRAAPVTSSLLNNHRGPEKGSRRLAEEIEKIIETAVRDTYRKREKPSVSALHDRVRELCHLHGLVSPSWKAVKARIELLDKRMLTRDREGPKAALDRFAPVILLNLADYMVLFYKAHRSSLILIKRIRPD